MWTLRNCRIVLAFLLINNYYWALHCNWRTPTQTTEPPIIFIYSVIYFCRFCVLLCVTCWHAVAMQQRVNLEFQTQPFIFFFLFSGHFFIRCLPCQFGLNIKKIGRLNCDRPDITSTSSHVRYTQFETKMYSEKKQNYNNKNMSDVCGCMHLVLPFIIICRKMYSIWMMIGLRLVTFAVVTIFISCTKYGTTAL